MLDLPFVQHVLVNHHPASLLSLLVRIQFVRQLPQMLTGVIKIDNLNCTGEMLFGNVPNPFRSIPHHDLLFRAALASIPGFQIDALTKLCGCFNRAYVSGRIGVADGVAFLVPFRLREHTSQLGLPRVGRLSLRLARSAYGFFFYYWHSRAVHLHIQDWNRTIGGRSNCMARWISSCSRAAISSPIASAFRSTALVLTSRSARTRSEEHTS